MLLVCTGLVIHSTVSTWQSAAHWWAPAGPSVRKRTGNLCSTDLAQQKFQTMWHSSQDFTEMPATRSKTLQGFILWVCAWLLSS